VRRTLAGTHARRSAASCERLVAARLSAAGTRVLALALNAASHLAIEAAIVTSSLARVPPQRCGALGFAVSAVALSALTFC
jgi:hypothetical protein